MTIVKQKRDTEINELIKALSEEDKRALLKELTKEIQPGTGKNEKASLKGGSEDRELTEVDKNNIELLRKAKDKSIDIDTRIKYCDEIIKTIDDIDINNTEIDIYRKALSYEQATALNVKGGLKSAKAFKERQSLGEELVAMLSTGDTQHKLCNALLQQGMGGNYKAFGMIRDTIGEMPTQKTELTTDIITDADRALLEKIDSRLKK